MNVYQIVTYSCYNDNWNWNGYTGDLYCNRENAIGTLADWKKIWENFIKYGVVLVEDTFESFLEFKEFCEYNEYRAAVGVVTLKTND